MKKRYGCIALAVFLLAGSVLTVHAEDYERKDGWKAEFTGESIESNFSSKDFAVAVGDLLPSDSITIYVKVKNGSKKVTDWYMSNEVLQSLEDSSPANGGAYTYELTWKGTGAKTTLYSNESVGGRDERPANLQGLHEAMDNLEEFFYLDQLSSGEEGQISLRVALNGETQGNNYQNTLARLRLNFAVEEVAAGESVRTTRRGESTVVYSPEAVQTSDPARMMFWSVATLISGLGFLICVVLYQKRSRGGDECE